MTNKEIETIRNRYYASYTSKFKKAISDSLLTYFANMPNEADLIEQYTLLYVISPNSYREVFEELYTIVGNVFGKATYNELLAKSGVKKIVTKTELSFTDYFLNYVESNAGELITLIVGTTKDDLIQVVRNVLADALANGYGVNEVIRNIQKEMTFISEYRAERIARTEIVRASNIAANRGALATGLDLVKKWDAFIDNRTRDSHIAANGQERGMSQLFDVGSRQMKYPGDPAGGASETINCRCSVQYRRR